MKSLKLRLESHFVAAAAMAAVAVLGGAQQAEATIVSSGPVNIPIPVTTSGVYLNFVTGVNNASPASVPGWDVNPWNSSNLSMFNPSTPSGGVYVGDGTGYFNLAIGTLISGASTFTSGVNAPASPLNLNSSNNYIGVRFTNENTSAVDYGWMQISLGASQTDPVRAIVAYAYDDSGAGITIPVPTPASLALLGLGGLGLVRRRR
jgi:MYXO-CTERM domain-containing protein